MLKQEIKNEFLKLTGLAAAIKGSIDTESGIVDKILTESLYDNTIGSPPREILMNAIDAMYQAGRGSEPVVIKFPNELDHDFYIKDSGIGLTSDEVKYLFQTLGASKKRRTGENGEMAMKHLTGEFGLGSKAFFAYTDAGWVIAAKDGMQETFFLSYDGDGNRVCIPVENSRVAAPSDWQNGVCVGYAIKPSDFGRFYTEVCEVLRWVNHPVTVLGYEDKIETPEPKFQGSNWALYNVAEVRQHYVRMGRIVYPLNTLRLGDLKPSWQVLLSDGKLILDVENKAVDVVANREALKYSEKTVNVLRERLDSLAQEFALHILEQVQTAITGNWSDKVKVAGLVRNSFSWLSTGRGDAILDLMGLAEDDRTELESVLKSRGAPLPKWVGDGNYNYAGWSAQAVARTSASDDDVPASARILNSRYLLQPVDASVGIVNTPVQVFGFCYEEAPAKSGRRRRRAVPAKFRKHEIIRGTRAGTRNSASSTASDEFVAYEPNVTIVIDDAPFARERIKEGMMEGRISKAYMVSAPKGTSKDELPAYAQRLSDAMGGWNIVTASSMAVPQEIVEARQRRALAKSEAVKNYADSDAELYRWNAQTMAFESVCEGMGAVLDLLYPEDIVHEDGTVEMVNSEFEVLPMLMPYRFGKGEIVLPGDCRESPAVWGWDFFEHFMNSLYGVLAPTLPEHANYFLIVPPQTIKSGKMLTQGGFKLLSQELNCLLDDEKITQHLQELTATLPKVLPFPNDASFGGHYEHNLVKRLFKHYKESLKTRDDDEDEVGPYIESNKSKKYRAAALSLSLLEGFESLPMLLNVVLNGNPCADKLNAINLFQGAISDACGGQKSLLIDIGRLSALAQAVQLPRKATALFAEVSTLAGFVGDCDLFKVSQDDPNLAVRYFMALQGVYLESKEIHSNKKAA